VPVSPKPQPLAGSSISSVNSRSPCAGRAVSVGATVGVGDALGVAVGVETGLAVGIEMGGRVRPAVAVATGPSVAAAVGEAIGCCVGLEMATHPSSTRTIAMEPNAAIARAIFKSDPPRLIAAECFAAAAC
jgi:hypothetical protein